MGPLGNFAFQGVFLKYFLNLNREMAKSDCLQFNLMN